MFVLKERKCFTMSTSKRLYKGSSLINFPDDYCVIDIETTGLNPAYDEIIEVGAVKVQEGKIIDKFSSLIKPTAPVSGFVSELTGITNEMLVGAPSACDVLHDFLRFVGSSIIVGHNVNFDINFLYDNSMALLEQFVKNDFVDTMRISRYLLRDLPHHRLGDLVNYYNLPDIGAHRVLCDCMQTHYVLCGLRSDAIDKYGTIKRFQKACK